MLVRAESDVFHTNTVYTIFVLSATLCSARSAPPNPLFSSRPDANNGHESPTHGAFLAVAEEEVQAAGGTEITQEDVRGREAGIAKLSAVGFRKIEEDVLGQGLVAGRHHVEPLDGIGFVAGAEFVEPFGGFR